LSTVLPLDPFEEILEDIRSGKPVVLVDDDDRENEGDLTIAAETVTPEVISFMMNEGRGLICISLEQSKVEAMGLSMQVSNNRSVFGTNFTVSLDHSDVVRSGVTASGRAKTISSLTEDGVSLDQFVCPGWVFPLSARPGGVFERNGQTEGSVDLARLAGLKPAGVICEIMDAEGQMLRGEGLINFCREHNLKITSVEEIEKYRIATERVVRRVAEAEIGGFQAVGLFSESGVFPLDSLGEKLKEPLKVLVYENDLDQREQLVIVKGEPEDGCLVRVHSECLTGDIFDSARCDCGDQLALSLGKLLEEGSGVIVYLQQEGRGIGLANKIRAYALQDQGRDTVEANIELGFDADQRDYRGACAILKDLGLSSVRLMTNNPAKVEALEQGDIKVSEMVGLSARVTPHNSAYIETKIKKMGHKA